MTEFENPLGYTGRKPAKSDRLGPIVFDTANFAITNKGKLSVKNGGISNDELVANGIQQDRFDENAVHVKCKWPVHGAIKNGGAASGSTGSENVLHFGEGIILEQHILGAGQTIIVPQLTSVGLDFGLDQTDNEGMELSGGIVNSGALAFTAQTDDPLINVTVKFEDASGVDPFYVGFRKQQAYQTGIGSYSDFFALGVEGTSNPNKIQFQTNLNGGTAATTDSTDTWADGEEKTITVKVGSDGVATGEIDGSAPSTTPSTFTFDSGDILTPFIFFLNGTDLAGKVEVSSIIVGSQT